MKKILLSKPVKTAFVTLAVLIFIASLIPVFSDRPGRANLYAIQAKAFLEGRLDIDKEYPDTASYKGRHYLPFPPFPAVVLLPFVAFFGATSTKMVIINLILSILNAITLTKILRKLEINPAHIPWLIAGLFLGTAYWLCLRSSHGVWYFAHIVSMTCMLLAINEAFGKKRGWLTGLLIGLSFLSRQLTIFASIFLLVAIWGNSVHPVNKKKIINAAGFIFTLAFCVGVYLIYNQLRFGDMFDTGYSYIFTEGFLKLRLERYGLFNPVYIPFNFIHMFVQGFHIKFTHSDYIWGIRTDPFGTSLTFASPFVFVALWANWKRYLKWTAWIGISIMIAGMLLYYNNGWDQVNAQRFTLDFFPILILLVALGTKRVPEHLWKSAIVYSIFMNVLTLFFVPFITGNLWK